MKICVYHNLSSGGALSLLQSQIKAMIENGDQVEIVTTTQSKEVNIRGIKVTKVDLDDYWLKRSRLGLLFKYSLGVHVFKQALKKIGQIINTGEYDLVYVTSCQYFYLPLISTYIEQKKKSILYLHEPYRWWYEVTVRNPWRIEYRGDIRKFIHEFVKNIALTFIQRISYSLEYEDIQGYNALLTNSLYSREAILRIYGLDARPIYPWIDKEFNVTSEKKFPYVIGCSFIHRSKNIEFIIRSIAKIAKTQRPELIWVANDSHEDYKRSLQSLSQKLGVHLVIEQAIPRERLIKLLSEAAVFAFAPRLEPFGLAPVEANLAGTYVVAIAEGGVRESIKDGVNGDLLFHEDEEEYSRLLSDYTGDLQLATEAGRRAQSYIKTESELSLSKNNFINEIHKIKD